MEFSSSIDLEDLNDIIIIKGKEESLKELTKQFEDFIKKHIIGEN